MATEPPTFTEVTDIIDVFGPLVGYSIYVGAALAVGLMCGLIFSFSITVGKWLADLMEDRDTFKTWGKQGEKFWEYRKYNKFRRHYVKKYDSTDAPW